jgi:ABC-type sugar transport system ATPase subunit
MDESILPRAVLRSFGLTKRYAGTTALAGVDVTVQNGSIHALIGQNGAGKSTFLGIVAGRVVPTSGRVELDGEPMPFGNPRRALSAGVAAIYQELSIVPALSTQANVFLAATASRHGVLQERRMRSDYVRLCEELGVRAHPDRAAGSLSIADQQVLEIMRGISSKARVLLFDEPTAALAPHERDMLFRLMRDLRRSGVTMLFVSHNLDEVLDIADRVTVFRDGRVSAELAPAGTTKQQLVDAMLGRVSEPSRPEWVAGGTDRIALKVVALRRPGSDAEISFEVRKGEILGIGGLVGSGRSSLLRSIAGVTRAHGQLIMDGRLRSLPSSPREARAWGIASIPEDRKRAGLIGLMSGADNILITDYGRVSRAGWIRGGEARRQSTQAAVAAGLDPSRLNEPSRNLSGGNQQKLLFARWAHRRPLILLADEPTRGIDVGAKQQILDYMSRLAAEGLAIILVSSELEEVAAVSHRVLVLARGRQVAWLDNTARTLTADDILRAAFEAEEALT